jgi:hypothetical protein
MNIIVAMASRTATARRKRHLTEDLIIGLLSGESSEAGLAHRTATPATIVNRVASPWLCLPGILLKHQAEMAAA